jgi:YfiH family protein
LSETATACPQTIFANLTGLPGESMLRLSMEASTEVISRREHDSLVWYACDSLGLSGDVVAAISTRHGGVSEDSFASLNLSYAVGDDPDRVRENRRRFAASAGFDETKIVCAEQVHGNRIAYVDERNAGAGFERRETAISDVDGLITDHPGLALWLGFADCVPILVHDPVRQAIGIAHAGWRGTLAGVASRLVEALAERLGSRVSDLNVVVGPSIGPCCYAVGSEVKAAFERVRGDAEQLFSSANDASLRLNLWEANRLDLVRSGVQAESIAVAARCTACQVDEFFSHRAQGGRAGRIAAVIALREGG